MRITLAYNLRTKETEELIELLPQEDIDRLHKALQDLGHIVTLVEVTGKTDEIIDRILDSEPEFIFNVAEGIMGDSREAFYPVIYENLSIPFTGSGSSLLLLNLNKHLTKTVVSTLGINVPKGAWVTENNKLIPKNLKYPLFIKPNAEGSSKGISQKSVVENENDCKERINELLKIYPSGLVVEEFISGRELSVPMLEMFPGQILGIVEYVFDMPSMNTKYNIYDFNAKFNEESKFVKHICPAELSAKEYDRIIKMSKKIFNTMNCKDMGRVDLRLNEEGEPYFLEINPLPSLYPNDSLMLAASSKGLSYKDVIELIIKSALRRYQINIQQIKLYDSTKVGLPKERPTLREKGISIGYFDECLFDNDAMLI